MNDIDTMSRALRGLDLAFASNTEIDTYSSPVPSTYLTPHSRGGLFGFTEPNLQKATPKRHLMRFKPARLIIPSATSKDQRPFIKVYAPDYSSGKLKLKKIYAIPGENIKQIKSNAQQMILEINSALENGAKFDRPAPIEAKTSTLREIIESYRESQRTARSYGTRLDTALRPYERFCEKENELKKNIDHITQAHAQNFLQSLKSKGLSARTINNYVSYAKTVWIHADNVSDGTVRSPFEKIKKLPIENSRNVAYQPEDLPKLKKQHAKYPDLAFLAQFMYYTLTRTTELAQLQVKHIGLYQPDQVYISASTSKNSTERHVIIPPPLQALIDKHKIKSFPPDYYVFSLVPGQGVKNKVVKPLPKKVGSSRLGERYRRYILNPLKFSKDYTLYSWKHTGVISAHNAGVTDADIMQQTGHKNYHSFTVYMKSLGLFARGQFAKLIPEI